ncbi:MAG: DUF2914 domain-containing protein [Candidatus Magasanikbacteria bacterium]|nr:DUF2914 domain-containing protein [Candidatus Magasanikbacteria bacterium]
MKEQIKQFIRYHAIKSWLAKYERLLMPATLILGSVLDFVTFRTIEIFSSFVLLAVYLVIATFGITFVYMFDADKFPKNRLTNYLRISMPFVIQFLFGALLSGTMVFYFFSGAVAVNWPIILLFVFLMIANEVFKSHYERQTVQLGVYFFILYTFLSVLLPFAFNTISAWSFVLSGLLSVFAMSLYLWFLIKLSPRVKTALHSLFIVISSVVCLMQWLYFTNRIPPVPLALRESVIAHNLKRTSAGYILSVENERWWNFFIPNRVVRIVGGERVYLYTSVFAPVNLSTTIIHRWQYFDETQKGWVARDRLSFSITGGKKSGYRGYSFKTNVSPGKWRVDVETERGQVLGRVNFSVESVDTPPTTQTVTK